MANKDEAVGMLTDSEIQFLESNNASVLEGTGSHSEIYRNSIVQGFSEAFGID